MNFSVVHHISLNVSNTEEAQRFYTDILKFTSIQRPAMSFNGAWLQLGDQQLHLIEVENHLAPAGQHFAMQVDDIQASRNYLIAHDLTVSEPSQMADVCLQCFFRDPSGNLLELNQPLQ